jgi:hypothetical protein
VEATAESAEQTAERATFPIVGYDETNVEYSSRRDWTFSPTSR